MHKHQCSTNVSHSMQCTLMKWCFLLWAKSGLIASDLWPPKWSGLQSITVYKVLGWECIWCWVWCRSNPTAACLLWFCQTVDILVESVASCSTSCAALPQVRSLTSVFEWMLGLPMVFHCHFPYMVAQGVYMCWIWRSHWFTVVKKGQSSLCSISWWQAAVDYKFRE